MHENQPIPLDPKRPATHRKSAANQLQIIANHMICRLPHSMLFDPLICTDLQLICTLQITANQTLSTFEKRYKTRANQRKSLQITSLKNHSKNDADLQSKWRVRPSLKGGRKTQDFIRAVK